MTTPRWVIARRLIVKLLDYIEADMTIFDPQDAFSSERPRSITARIVVALRALISSRTQLNCIQDFLQLIASRGLGFVTFVRLFLASHESLLVSAVLASRPEIIRPLVSSGIVAIGDRGGRSEKNALHTACESGALECVRVLLELGALPSEETSSGRNCLHLAVEREHFSVVELLCNHAAVHDILHSRHGQASPFILAENKGRMRMVHAMLDCYKRTATGETVNAFLNSKLEKYASRRGRGKARKKINVSTTARVK
jgi:hypothetical protein